jgi:hypothetical protein
MVNGRPDSDGDLYIYFLYGNVRLARWLDPSPFLKCVIKGLIRGGPSILTGDRLLFKGQHLCPEFDCPQGPLPDKLEVLLCLLDGAERRRLLQAKLNRLGADPER